MAGNRNRPSMGMNIHSEHLRSLNYSMTGMKVEDDHRGDRPTAVRCRRRNADSGSIQSARSSGSARRARVNDEATPSVGNVNSRRHGNDLHMSIPSGRSHRRHSSDLMASGSYGTYDYSHDVETHEERIADTRVAYNRRSTDPYQTTNNTYRSNMQNFDMGHEQRIADPHVAYNRRSTDPYQTTSNTSRSNMQDLDVGYNGTTVSNGATYRRTSVSNSYVPRSHRHNGMNSMRSSDTSNSTQDSRIAGNLPRSGIQQKTQIQYNSMSNPASINSYQGFDDSFDDDASRCTRTHALHRSATNRAKDMTYPRGDVTIIFTDVQGSTSLWEACPTDMKKAQDIHDVIMRQCYANHSGYEITTEGDAFILAFHHPVDALAFALEAQLKLYKADWPPGILKHDDGKDEPSLKFRGFRVRFGVHHGPTTSKVHEMTRRTVYSGEAVKIAKSVEGMCHGGQILCTMETWMAVSGMAERYLGRPQILDCGEHLLFETSDGTTVTRYKRRIMQLVPQELAFDFFEARGRREVPSNDGSGTLRLEIKNASTVKGRLFPPILSKKQLTTGFLNAPYANGRVTICFMYTNGVEDTNVKESIAKFVRKELKSVNPPGYECQEDNGCWMLAFDRMASAVFFGIQLVSSMENKMDRDDIFKIGIVTGPYTSMGPHKTTGMADYFGPIVNRAARVASNCQLGQVCVGIPLDDGVAADPPDFGPEVSVHLEGMKKLKGISVDTAIFSCRLSRAQTGYAYY